MIIITDIHGCYNTLIRLLNKCPEGPLIFGGDLIDRGPDSKSVVELAMNGKVPTVMGNHEDLALAYSEHAKLGYKSHAEKHYERNIWLYNGGDGCLESFGVYSLPKEVLDWMQNLPPYIQHDKLLISHTGYGLDPDWFHVLWKRYSLGDGEFPVDGLFRVYGHTQQKTVQMTDEWAMIDTGAAYHGRGMGVLSAFEWPSKRIISQDYDETPAKPNFKIVDGILTR